jgi:hypothetical protein
MEGARTTCFFLTLATLSVIGVVLPTGLLDRVLPFVGEVPEPALRIFLLEAGSIGRRSLLRRVVLRLNGTALLTVSGRDWGRSVILLVAHVTLQSKAQWKLGRA